jgi:hypothetical protein
MALFTKGMALFDVISCFKDFSGIVHEGFMTFYDAFWPVIWALYGTFCQL